MSPLSSSLGLPEHARRVFTGVIFDVWHWDQEMFDGSTETFEAVTRVGSVTTIPVTERGTILVNEESQPGQADFLSLPAGRLDGYDEDPEVGAARELREETGYESSDWELLTSVEPRPGDKVRWPRYLFVARGCRRVVEPHLDAGERIQTQEVSFDELLALPNNPRFRGGELARLLREIGSDPDRRQEFREKLLRTE